MAQQRILNLLERSARNGRLAHAYLFTGSNAEQQEKLTVSFIQKLQGSNLPHPDVSFLSPEIIEKNKIKKESEISIKQIRDLEHRLSLFAFQGPYKIVVIKQAEKLSPEASNALLKTLEEPTLKTILILLTSAPNFILPTIASRCQIIKLPALSLQFFKKGRFLQDYDKSIQELSDLAQADLAIKYKYAAQLSENPALARQCLKTWIFIFRDLILLKIKCPECGLNSHNFKLSFKTRYSLEELKKIIQAIKETDLILSNASFNAKLALEYLMLKV